METIEFGTVAYDRYKHDVIVEETVKDMLIEHICFNNPGNSMPSDDVHDNSTNALIHKLKAIIVTADEGTEERESQIDTVIAESVDVYSEARRIADHRWKKALWAMGLVD